MHGYDTLAVDQICLARKTGHFEQHIVARFFSLHSYACMLTIDLCLLNHTFLCLNSKPRIEEFDVSIVSICWFCNGKLLKSLYITVKSQTSGKS